MLRLKNSSAGKTVVLAGGGIVNLVTAYYLVKNGYSVRIFDRAPDPATRPDRRLLGCSAGGGNSRVFSINEARHHFVNSRHYEGDVVSPFKRTIAEDGYLAVPPSSLNNRDFKWNERFEAVTRELATRFNQDIISFNRESEPLWREMIAAHPVLFQKSGFIPGLFRLYATGEKFARAQVTEKAIGALKRILSPDEIAGELPALRDALEANAMAGALEVTGFSVNIHALVDCMIAHLSSQGAGFHWRVKIDGIERDRSGLVKGLKAGSQTIEACHYVISPGAYSQELLAGFSSADAIAPVIGLWLTIPNMTPPLDHPLKVARAGFASAGAAEGANIVPGVDHEGRPVIHVSSGHGYLGFGNESRPYRDEMGLGRAVEETAGNMFPKARWLADVIRAVNREDRTACVRPWTATGLGIFESTGTDRDGSFIITGGHNTGGFAQAPAIAMAVLAAIERHSHPMHILYHPKRLEMASVP
jgi:D-amino-acid dehydrogenase